MQPVIEAEWDAPQGVVAFTTTRLGGESVAPYDSFNLGSHVDDDSSAVISNRKLLAERLPTKTPVLWLNQVHGTQVVEASNFSSTPDGDAVFARQVGVPCAVLTADCLPVLLCSVDGDVVAAAHAGWRGLQAGVLEATVQKMGCAPDAIMAWMGPAIGPQSFEVGPEVRDAFLAGVEKSEQTRVKHCFCPSVSRSGFYYADLYGLARQRLAAAGVARVTGGEHCTHADSRRFYSYRRDGQTGRMASLILIT